MYVRERMQIVEATILELHVSEITCCWSALSWCGLRFDFVNGVVVLDVWCNRLANQSLRAHLHTLRILTMRQLGSKIWRDQLGRPLIFCSEILVIQILGLDAVSGVAGLRTNNLFTIVAMKQTNGNYSSV
jgi:hypothetical protein